MQKYLAVICVTLMVRTVYTAVATQPAVEKPPEFADQQGCYSPELNIVLPYNEKYSPADGKSCKEYICQYDGDTQIYTCGALGAGPGCQEVRGNLSLPYPDCCNTIVCDPSQTPPTAPPSTGPVAMATACA